MTVGLQPTLLDRLTDDEPSNRKAEANSFRGWSIKQLRASICRDLEYLLNSVNLESAVDLSAYPHVARSVVNYGISEFAGKTLSSIATQADEAVRMLQATIIAFEPRLESSSVKVELVRNAEASVHNQLQFYIHADVRTDSLRPVPLALRADLNLETGHALITDATGDHRQSEPPESNPRLG